MVAVRNSSLATSARRKPVLVVRPRISVRSRASHQGAPGGLAVGAVGDDLAEHRVVRRADDLPALEGLVDAYAVRPPHQVGPAGLREEAAEGVLGVDPGLDRVTVDADVVLVEGQRLAGGDVELEVDEVEAGDGLGDRVLDLEAGVHLQEVGLVGRGVEQELHGAGVGVADLAGQGDGARGDQMSYLVADGRRRRLLEHLLVAALGRAVTLVEVHHVAVVVGEDLHLDVAAVLDVLLDQDRVVAERREGLALGGGDRLVVVLGSADDAHPLAAAAGRGLDEHREGGVLPGRARRVRRRVRRSRGRRPCGPSAPSPRRSGRRAGSRRPRGPGRRRRARRGSRSRDGRRRRSPAARPRRPPRCRGSCGPRRPRRPPGRAGRRGRRRCRWRRCAGRSPGRRG